MAAAWPPADKKLPSYGRSCDMIPYRPLCLSLVRVK